MSIAQTQPLVDSLVKAKIPKETATKLIDFIEQNQSQELKQDVENIKVKIEYIKWIITLGFTFVFMIMIYLHSNLKSDLKSDISDLKSDINKRINKLDTRMDKIENKLDLILKKK